MASLSSTLACGPADVSPGSASYQAGHLGNGGFAFTCDDSVVCGKYNAAKEFPDAVALGSKFTVRYIPKSGDSTGVTLDTVARVQLSNTGAGSFVAVSEGTATIVAKDVKGNVLEWLELPIKKPDTIVIYKDETPITKAILDATESSKAFRATARWKNTDLAGALTYEWKASDSSVIDVRSDTDGTAVVTPLKTGTATLTATGGTFTQSIEVDVR